MSYFDLCCAKPRADQALLSAHTGMIDLLTGREHDLALYAFGFAAETATIYS
jgi:hypothetical protein